MNWTKEFIAEQKSIAEHSSAKHLPKWGVYHSKDQEDACNQVAQNVRNGFGACETDLEIWSVWYGKDAEGEMFTAAITGNGPTSKQNALFIQEAFAHYPSALEEIERLQRETERQDIAIAVLSRKNSFLNRDLKQGQEKQVRQASRIEELEALYKGGVKSKKVRECEAEIERLQEVNVEKEAECLLLTGAVKDLMSAIGSSWEQPFLESLKAATAKAAAKDAEIARLKEQRGRMEVRIE